jgi:hypothetical protein
MKESRASEVSKAKYCSGAVGVVGNATYTTNILPSRATAEHEQPKMGITALALDGLACPRALPTALSYVSPYAKKLQLIAMNTRSHFLNNALAS